MRTLLNKLESAFGTAIQVRTFGRSERFVVEAEPARIVEVAAWLRMEESFRMDVLECLTLFENRGRFTFSYFIRSNSQTGALALRMSCATPPPSERATVPSMIGIWPQAEPFEAELAPLFGVDFAGARGAEGVRKQFGSYDGFPLRKAFQWGEGPAP